MERDLDAQVSPTELEDEVGGKQGLERDVEVKVGAIKLDEIRSGRAKSSNLWWRRMTL